MKEAVIVSTARTPIGKAYRGAFNNTEAPTLASHAIRHAVERAGVAPEEVATDPEVETAADGLVYEATLAIDCSSGTYVRSLARDIAAALGSVGHVHALRRTRVGPFVVEAAQPAAVLADPAATLTALRSLAAALRITLSRAISAWLTSLWSSSSVRP